MRWRFASVLLTAFVVSIVHGQKGPEQPTFRSGVRYIEVDVLVTDRKGQAVRGLAKDDFTLLEDGTPQPIVNFAFVDIPVEAGTSRKAAVADVESDITSNVGEGRTYVLALNRGGHRVRLIARRFVEEAIGPNDQVAVIQVLGNMSAAQGFTRSRALMLRAIDRLLIGGGDNSTDGGSGDGDGQTGSAGGIGDPTLQSFAVIEELAKTMGQMSGRRKAIIWVDPPSVFHGAGIRAAGERFAQRDAVRAATRNNVAFYVVSSQGLTTRLGLARLEYKAGLRVLADDTGGDVIVESNNFSPAFERFARDNSTYYLLAYEPPLEYQDGKFHPLTVRVNRPGVTVRSRRGYYAPEADPVAAVPAAAAEALAAARPSADTLRALHLPSSSGELVIDLVATPIKGPERHGTVLLAAQLRGRDLVLGPKERVEVAFEAMTTEGKVTPGSFDVFTLDLTDASRATVAQAGLRVLEQLDLPRGRHQVRFAVHQPNGKTGSVVADVEIPNYTAPLVLSGVVIGAPATAPRTLALETASRALLSVSPTALRRFTPREDLTAAVEVYTADRTPADLTVSARLTRRNGGQAHTPALRTSAEEPGRTGVVLQLPLRDVRPGEYVLTVEARTSDRTATRQVLLSVVAESAP